ncbi:hypothetical protein ACFO26_09250 [Lactococcus nasutitermitis]|uniref:Uncharacterized protein n=1 Tax=Lactococcus nasutitermitis TaxID=1652957 RepID=A0ABV9JF10_9LACT|nr:hypothetical protein [Lactococcus nasutitermitis]
MLKHQEQKAKCQWSDGSHFGGLPRYFILKRIIMLIGILKSRLPQKFFMWINIVSGLVVLIYGIYLLVQALMMIF